MSRIRKPYIYLAGPLFSTAERSFNLFLKQSMVNHCDVYLPQEDGALMPDLIEGGMQASQACRVVFQNDINAIERSDAVVVVLDGRSPDEGAAFELGFAYARQKTCVGLQTDFRRLSLFGNNPMLTGALEDVFGSVDDLLQWVRHYSHGFVNAPASPPSHTQTVTSRAGRAI